jgi:hypothetical protein
MGSFFFGNLLYYRNENILQQDVCSALFTNFLSIFPFHHYVDFLPFDLHKL